MPTRISASVNDYPPPLTLVSYFFEFLVMFFVQLPLYVTFFAEFLNHSHVV